MTGITHERFSAAAVGPNQVRAPEGPALPRAFIVKGRSLSQEQPLVDKQPMTSATRPDEAFGLIGTFCYHLCYRRS